MAAVTRVFPFLTALLATVASAHDASVEIDGSATTATSNNPRVGSLGVTAGGGLDLADDWTLWATLGYRRDLATRAAGVSASGGNLFQLSGGAMWFGSYFSALLSVSYSPPAQIRSAVTVPYTNKQTGQTSAVEAVVLNGTSSVGFTAGGGLRLGSFSSFASLFLLQANALHYDLTQQYQLPSTPRGRAFSAYCQNNPGVPACSLLNDGLHSEFWQVQLNASYTATVRDDLDVGLDGALYLYDTDPAKVGYFSVAVLGRTVEVGSGSAIAPLLGTLKPFVAYRWKRWSMKASYQFGVYAAGEGLSHVVALRPAFKLTDSVKLTLSLVAQGDFGKVGTTYGATAILGAMWVVD